MIPENILNQFYTYQIQMNIFATYDFADAANLCDDYVSLEKEFNDQDLPRYKQTVNTESNLYTFMQDVQMFVDKELKPLSDASKTINSKTRIALRRTPLSLPRGGRATWLINSSEDADFLFESVEFTTYCAPNPDNSIGSPSLGLQLEGELQITEVSTARFMDTLVSLRPVNHSEFKCLTLVLAPTVYGYQSIDSTTPVIIPMNPVAFLVTDINSSYTDQGAKYNISLIGITNGFANLPSQSDINQSIVIKLAPRTSLAVALQTYAEALNAKFAKDRAKQNANGSNFVDIEYRITIDDEYQDLPTNIAVDLTDVPYSDPIYAIDNINGLVTSLNSSDATMTFKNGTIIDGIQEILKHSLRVVDDFNPRIIKSPELKKAVLVTTEKSDTIFDFLDNIKTNLASTKLNEKWVTVFEKNTEFSISSKPTVITNIEQEDSKMIISFRVVKTYVVTSDDPNGETIKNNTFVEQIQDCLSATSGDKNNVFKNPIFKNLLYYDYLFTGQNVDVLDYSMNLSQGVVFVNTIKWEQALNLGKSGVAVTSISEVHDHIPDFVSQRVPTLGTAGETICDNYYVGAKQYTSVNRNVSTVKDPEQTSSYYDKLNRYSVKETISQEITVTGNPILWGSFVSNNSLKTKTTDPLNRWDVFPPLMYINIRYPTNPNYNINRDVVNSVEMLPNEEELLTPFWFRGLLRIFAIKTVVDRNQFTHIITSYPLMTTKQAAQKVSESLQKEATAEQQNNEDVPEKGSNSNRTYTSTVARKAASAAAVVELLPSAAKFMAASGTPLAGNLVLTSGYSLMRRLKKRSSPHLALDLRADVGTAVFSMTAGVVLPLYLSDDDTAIKIKTPTGVIITYLHVAPIKGLKEGDVVTPGQKIATIRKFKPNSEYNKEHLHLAIEYKGKKYNPEQVLSIKQTNGTPDAVLHFGDKK